MTDLEKIYQIPKDLVRKVETGETLSDDREILFFEDSNVNYKIDFPCQMNWGLGALLDVYITSKSFILFDPEENFGWRIPYKLITLHAKQSNPKPFVYLQLEGELKSLSSCKTTPEEQKSLIKGSIQKNGDKEVIVDAHGSLLHANASSVSENDFKSMSITHAAPVSALLQDQSGNVYRSKNINELSNCYSCLFGQEPPFKINAAEKSSELNSASESEEDATESSVFEITLFVSDFDACYQALCSCQSLHPDPLSDEEEQDAFSLLSDPNHQWITEDNLDDSATALEIDTESEYPKWRRTD
ncbi:splicing factor Saf5 [Schizosaccharomyces osmophilus]|uniref:Splicing factor Saf5 n=1 Tax=Schizosaccharomyces osmophilus TaxID=2545709 RepID=A0AAF0AV38_9SCHI|nr:splicing factor Saf5 [Schizosaccharomyces osmophilus]WBW72018.1 splicing factor Saf5 [Schizosaccharomyces osmophilus]